MCGRYAQTQTEAVLVPRFALDEVDHPVEPTWNAAPTQQLPVVVAEADRRRLIHARWGFAPAWATSKPIINAQSDGVADKPTFRSALRSGRCVVPACAFYEWRRVGSQRQPQRFYPAAGAGLAFAGLVADFELAGERRRCFTILTTRPNAVVAPVHDRMPAVLADEAALSGWLAGGLDAADLGPLGEDGLLIAAADPALNRVGNDGPELWRPPEQTSLF